MSLSSWRRRSTQERWPDRWPMIACVSQVNPRSTPMKTRWDAGGGGDTEITSLPAFTTTFTKVDKARRFSVRCCCHSDQGCMLLRSSAWAADSWAMYVLTHIFVLHMIRAWCVGARVFVWAPEDVRGWALRCSANVSFHLPYQSLICSERERQFPIHIQILSFMCWEPGLCLRGLSCWKEAPWTPWICEFEDWLSPFLFDDFTKAFVCACSDFFHVFPHCPPSSLCTGTNLSASPPLFSP